MSINQFIRIVKLKKAAQLLTYEDVTVSETAFQLGFTDLKYFRTCFKDKFGILPSEYQKQNLLYFYEFINEILLLIFRHNVQTPKL